MSVHLPRDADTALGQELQGWTLQFKTRADLFDELEKAINAVRTYQTPEIAAIPIVAGNQSFLVSSRKKLRIDKVGLDSTIVKAHFVAQKTLLIFFAPCSLNERTVYLRLTLHAAT